MTFATAALAVMLGCGVAQGATADDPIAFGTNQRFTHLGLEEGLAQSTVYTLLQDRQGYVWMGTQAGLHRFDGYGFKIYRHDGADPSSISDSQVFTMAQARDGAIWIGTLNGLNRFDPITETFTRYQHGDADDTLSSDDVIAIVEDRAGHIWVGTGNGLSRLDPATGKFRRYLAGPKGTPGLRHNIVRALHEDRAGDIWIGSNLGVSVYRSKADKFEALALSGPKVAFDDVPINTIRGDPKGNVWVGATTGLASFSADGTRIAEYVGAEKGGPLGTGRVADILFSRTGEVWLAVYRTGLVQLEPGSGRVTMFRHDPADRTSLSDDTAIVLMEDRGGVLWVGTENSGANRYNPATRRFLHYRHKLNQPRALFDHVVWSVLPARDGSLWVGQETGLTRIDRARGEYRHFRMDAKKPGALRGEFVSALFQDADGTIWVGTDKSLHRLQRDGVSFQQIKFKGDDPDDELALNSAQPILGDGADGLWVGSSAGLVHYLPATGAVQRFRHVATDPTTIGGNFVLALYRSRDGALWVGTDGGVAVRQPGAAVFERLPTEGDRARVLANPFVQAIVEDVDGVMWFGTAEGLSRYDRVNKGFQHFSVEQGLPNETIYTLLRTDDGMLWMSTNRGLARFDPRSHAVRSWLVEDGLQSNEFNGGAAARSADGELFFGGVNGVNAFRPAALEERDIAPTVAITEIELLDRAVPISGELARTRQLVLDHTQPSVTLHFAVFDYAAPLKNRFQFILEGFDPGWRDGRTRSSVTYTNLDPGTYTFRVKGANTHAVWSLEEATLQVVVLPPPWLTWWAYLGYVLLAFALVALIARAHHLKLKRDHEFEAEQAKRRWSETLHQLAQSLSSSLDAHQIAELLLDSLRRMVTFRTAALFVEQGVDLQLVGTRGFPEEEAKQLRSLPEARARLFAECRHRREPMMLGAEDVRDTPLAGDGPTQAHVLAIPTYSRSEEFSLLLLGRGETQFSAQEQEIAIAVVRQALVALDNARLFSELQNLATTDNLTKVNNRRYFFELAELEFARGRRYGRNLAVILLDADGFTQLNEAHGHEIGDRVLRLIASTCRANLRHFDIIGRYGGEDFVVMLPETALNVAADVADRLRKAVESMVIETHSGELRVTVSLGVAIATPDVPDLATLINRADMALYEAKRSGRNRVVVSEQG
jgi:diguanylate cyclase (GGDEF)-like protein